MAKKPKVTHVFNPPVGGRNLPIYKVLQGRQQQFAPKVQEDLSQLKGKLILRKFLRSAEANSLQDRYNSVFGPRRFLLRWSREHKLSPQEKQRCLDAERGF